MDETMNEADAAAARDEGAAARFVPLSAMLGERERRQAAERELAALRAQAEAGEAAPDLEALNARFHESEAAARTRHGDALVDAVQAWASRRMAEDADFARAVLAHEDPYAMAVAWSGEAPEAECAPAPRSLVAAPSAGGAAYTPVGPGQAFDAVFRR